MAWEEDMDDLFTDKTSGEEKESVEHCRNSDFKYYIFYVTGQEYTYTYYENIPKDNAVSIINKNLNKKLNIETTFGYY